MLICKESGIIGYHLREERRTVFRLKGPVRMRPQHLSISAGSCCGVLTEGRSICFFSISLKDRSIVLQQPCEVGQADVLGIVATGASEAVVVDGTHIVTIKGDDQTRRRSPGHSCALAVTDDGVFVASKRMVVESGGAPVWTCPEASTIADLASVGKSLLVCHGNVVSLISRTGPLLQYVRRVDAMYTSAGYMGRQTCMQHFAAAVAEMNEYLVDQKKQQFDLFKTLWNLRGRFPMQGPQSCTSLVSLETSQLLNESSNYLGAD